MTINDDGHSSEGLAECTKETSEAEKVLKLMWKTFGGHE